MSLKLWDVNMERTPVRTVYVHEQLRSKLCDLYENDAIFDKFQCAFSGDNRCVAFVTACVFVWTTNSTLNVASLSPRDVLGLANASVPLPSLA